MNHIGGPLALLVVLIVLAGQAPFAFRRSGSRSLWLVGLGLAVISVAVILALIYLGSAFAGTSGDIKRVQSAWHFALWDAGGALMIAALLAPSIVAAVLLATETSWGRMARTSSVAALVVIHVLMASVTLPLFVKAASDFAAAMSTRTP